MDKSLFKIYFITGLILILIITFFPVILPNTSKAVNNVFIILNTYIKQSQRDKHYIEADLNKGKITIVMDDGWLSQYSNGYNIMKKYNIKGNIAVIPTRVGQNGYMSIKQLSQLYLNGWDMLNHTYNHENLSSLTYEEQEMQIIRAKSWIERHGFRSGSDILVVPGGIKNDNTFDILNKHNFVACRGLEDVWTISPNARLGEIVIINLTDHFTLEEIFNALNLVIVNKSCCIIILHKIESGYDSYHMNYSVENFEKIIEYLVSKKDYIQIVTLSEMIKYYN